MRAAVLLPLLAAALLVGAPTAGSHLRVGDEEAGLGVNGIRAPVAEPGEVDFSVGFASAPQRATKGDRVIYRVAVANAGPDDGVVRLTVATSGVPARFDRDFGPCDSLSSLMRSCGHGPVAFTPVALGAGKSATIEFPFVVDDAGTLSVRAEAQQYLGLERDASDNAAETTTQVVVPLPDLTVKTTTTAAAARAGDTLTVTTTVTNSAPGWASGVTLSTQLSPGLDLVRIGGAGPCDGLTCRLGDIPSGGGWTTVDFVVRVSTAGHYTVTSTASANEPDADVANNSGSVGIDVAAAPDTAAPIVRAHPSVGRHGAPTSISFSVSDDSGRAHVVWRVTKNQRAVATGSAWYASATIPYIVRRRLAAGTYLLTVTGTDAAGNTSTPSSASIRVR